MKDKNEFELLRDDRFTGVQITAVKHRGDSIKILIKEPDYKKLKAAKTKKQKDELEFHVKSSIIVDVFKLKAALDFLGYPSMGEKEFVKAINEAASWQDNLTLEMKRKYTYDVCRNIKISGVIKKYRHLLSKTDFIRKTLESVRYSIVHRLSFDHKYRKAKDEKANHIISRPDMYDKGLVDAIDIIDEKLK